MTDRFEMHLGANWNSSDLCEMSTEDLATLIRESNEWDIDLVRDLCWRAGITDEEWEAAEDCNAIVDKAAAILGVEIY